MGLQVWLPLNGNTNQQGLSSITMTGSPNSWVDGKIGKCAHFTGSVSNVIYNNTTDFNYTDDFSWTIWVKTNYTGSNAQYVFTNGRADAGGYGYGLQCISASNCSCRFGNVSYNIPVSGGSWTHITFTKHGTTIIIYVNGNVVSTNTFVGILPTYSDGNGLGLGCFHYTSNIYPFYGDINDFRIYDHALSPREVKEISKGLVLHYPLSGIGNPNLINKLYAAGRTTVNGRTVTALLSQNLDTYFHFSCSETVTAGIDYTLSMDCSGFADDTNYLVFGVVAQNSGKNITLRNGHCSLTFQFNSDIAANTKIIVDDINRGTSGYTNVTITNIKLEKGDKSTPWLPNSSDTLYTALGLNDGIEYDVSGYGNNGTKIGTLTYVADTMRYNTSVKLNGATEYISIPAKTFDMTNISFSAWAKWNAFNTWSRVFDLGEKAGGSGYSFLVANNGTSLVVGGRLAGGATLPDTTIMSGLVAETWYHIIVTISGQTCNVYVNGQLKKTFSFNGSMGAIVPFNLNYLGKSNWSSDGYFNGQLSDFRIYATALSADDVLELYHTPMSLANNGALLTQGELQEV